MKDVLSFLETIFACLVGLYVIVQSVIGTFYMAWGWLF